MEFDAIVIGSGITGGWAAKELTERGLKVLMLERGRPLEHRTGYTTEFVRPWDAPLRGVLDREDTLAHYPIQSRLPWGQFSWANKHYWMKDSENPYVQAPDRPFEWHRADVLGGKSLLWGRQCYRWSDVDFTANARDGHGNDWPIRYKDLASHYSYVEKFVGITGENLGLPHFPDMELLPAMQLNAGEKWLKQKVEARWPGQRYVTLGRAANLSVPHEGRGPCQYRSICDRGCSFGGYFSSLSATLPAAKKTGLLTVRTNTVVAAIDTDPITGRASAVRVIDAKTGERSRVTAKLIFLNASTIASVQILLQSRSDRHPNGLGNQGDALGRYVVDHGGGGAFGVLPGMLDRYYFGRRPTGLYVPRFRNLNGRDEGVDFDRGYVMQGGVMRTGWTDQAADGDDYGADYKRRVARPGKWVAFLGGACETLPYKDSRVVLDEKATDRYGLPQLRFEVRRGENERKLYDDSANEAASMLAAAGAVDIIKVRHGDVPGKTIHEQGGARMGNDPAESVLNAHNQVHGVPNLFVTDGSAMASSGTVNPSLTFMALTVRAVDYAVTQLRAGQL